MDPDFNYENEFSFYETIDEVLPQDSEKKGGLFISGYGAATKEKILIDKNIKAVLSMLQLADQKFSPESKIVHKVINADDWEGYDISKDFKEALEFIEENIKKTNVLVHCLAGISRSATIVTAYLMTSKKMNYRDALAFLASKRKVVDPNPGFRVALKGLESKLKEKLNAPGGK